MNWQEAQSGLAAALAAFEEAMASYGAYLIGGLAVVLAAAFAYALVQRAGFRKLQGRLAIAQRTVDAVHPSKSVEHNLDALLEIAGGLVEAASYAFYVYDERNRIYVLKAVRHRAEDFGKIKPSYSGLRPYAKESYSPQLSFPESAFAPKTSIVQDGEVPLLQIPVGERVGVIRIGPIGGKLPAALRNALDELGIYMKHGVHFMLDKEKSTQQADVVISSGRALQQISHIALDPNVTIDLILELSMRTIGAAGGCFVRNDNGTYRLLAVKEMDAEAASQLQRDAGTLGMLHGLVRNRGHALIRRGDEAFYALPPYLAALGMERLVAVEADGPDHYLLYWFEDAAGEVGAGGIATLHMIMRDVRALLGYQSSLRQLSSTYTNILKKLSQLLDNLSPYTVGYSEQMSRYCIVIAQELGLPKDVIRDVALAGYLSNIGVLGISTDLYQKEGKYTDKEFELMKLHAEVGASIVKVTTGNEQAASYIMHHHERVDGNGYPSGLRGDSIPVGAKIIAVVQTFLAKINGRAYREPLSFSQALKTLKTASGTQLDPEVVDAFIVWMKRKQADPAYQGRSLGACWEMSCTPASICEGCPAFGRTDVNCWEVEGNHCKSHGKQCETCFVRTEVTTRSEVVSL